MLNHEIEKGEIITQNGIVNVLQQFGFTENKDFIFLDENNIRDKHGSSYVIAADGKPLYGLAAEEKREQESIVIDHFVENGKPKDRVQKISVQAMGHKWDENGHWKYGELGNNNGVYGIYISGQGLVLTKNVDMYNLMQQNFGLKDSSLGIPLSNGTQFWDKSLQDKWNAVQSGVNQLQNSDNKNESKASRFQSAMEKLMKKLDVEKMPLWAQEQLKNKNMNM